MRWILKYPGELRKGTIIDRPNRFTLLVRINSKLEKIYLPNPGKLSTVLSPGREILCEPSSGKGRKTRFSAFAVHVGKFYVTVNSAFANRIFFAALKMGALKEFRGHTIAERELRFALGRIDFVLRTPVGKRVYVEVKSCTHVENGVAKFPDRPTERGRRHLTILSKLAERGAGCYMVFIVQRPDARTFKPFREIDPKFADALKGAVKKGVKVKAISSEFRPPNLYLRRNLLVRLT